MAGNTSYPHAAIIRDAGSLRAAVAHDYVAARFRGSYRSLANFIEANCLCKDCDNDHSDEPDDWVTPEHVRSAFPDVPLAIHYSRNHMRPKRGKAPRPKFHCILLTDNITSAEEYKQLAKRAHDVFPFFDTRAEDAAHFFFGTPDAQVEFYPGTCTLNECLAQCYPDEDLHDDGGTEARATPPMCHGCDTRGPAQQYAFAICSARAQALWRQRAGERALPGAGSMLSTAAAGDRARYDMAQCTGLLPADIASAGLCSARAVARCTQR